MSHSLNHANEEKAFGFKSPQQSEDAQRVYLEDKFATREEVAEIKQQHRAEVSDLHARLRQPDLYDQQQGCWTNQNITQISRI